MTQSLKQAIELLQLSTIELYEKITNELVDNPVLEEESGSGTSPLPGDSGQTDGAVRDLAADETRLARADERSVQNDDGSDQGYAAAEDDEKKRYTLESYYAREESLTEHLLWQARMTARNEKEFGVYESIITSLDENGFLPGDESELFTESAAGPEAVENALAVIRLFDPVGCAVRNVRESLSGQCAHFYPSDEVLLKMVGDCFEMLKSSIIKRYRRVLAFPLPDIAG